MIQDIGSHSFQNEFLPGAVPKEDSPVLRFKGRDPLARYDETDGKIMMEFPKAGQLDKKSLVFAFKVDETEYFMDISGNTDEIEGFEYAEFKKYWSRMSNIYGLIVFTGDHLNQWYSTSNFCGYCGTRTEHSKTERARHCPNCGKEIYPSILPAVIVGVKNGDRLLMTKYKTGIGYYALIAGFVEIGETLEQCVEREVMEEAGVKVKNITYYKSQPWGMAKDLLAGFYCDVDGDDTIRMDESELKLAEWVERDKIELQPHNYSLTNEMMTMFKNGVIR